MKTHLAFLHIEKAAGSAQRLYFNDVLGKDNVFWRGVSISPKQKKSIYNFFLIGGHESYPFYDNNDLIYTAVTRNPIDRVLSFYNYCKEVIPESWVPLGLDVHSLKNTIKLCKQFRFVIKNGQCRYISGSEQFDNVISVIFKKSFLIGCLENINIFNSHIARNLELYYKELPLDNVGKQGYVNELELDEECLAEIEELISEDTKLYKFISEDCKGLYSSVSDQRWSLAKTALSELRSKSKLSLVPDICNESIRELVIQSARFVLLDANFLEQSTVHRSQTICFELEFSIARTMETLEIGIHIFDSSNHKVFGTDSTMLGKILTNVNCGIHRVRYNLVADLNEGQYTAGFTFTECRASEYYEIKRYDGLVTFSVTIPRLMPSVGYASLPCEFAYQQTSDAIIGFVEDAAGSLFTDTIIGNLATNEIINLPVKLENISAQTWMSIWSHPINLSYHWLDQMGNIVVFDGKRSPLPSREILPGQTLTTQMKVMAPDTPGLYRLMLLPVQEKHCWFDKCGFTPGMLELEVVASGAARYIPAADLRLLSQVGKREESSIISTGCEGFLLFGPYLRFPAGQYVARLEGSCELGTPGIWLDVVCDQAKRVLVRQEIIENAKPGLIAEQFFELAETVNDLEVRLWVTANALVHIEALRIEPSISDIKATELPEIIEVSEISPSSSALQ